MNLSGFSLKQSVAGLEDGIIVLSGPALAISGIIAGVDLVTGGNILKSMWWLSLVWAITLLLTLDFQVLCLGVRSHRVYIATEKGGWQKFFEILLAMAIAAAISYVSVQMQSVIARVNAENISIDVAAAQLGINTIALIWERSALVLVLIFMSGWFREHKEEKKEEVVTLPIPAPIDMAQIVDALENRMSRHIEAVIKQVEIKIDQVAQNSQEMPAITPAMIAGLLPPPEPGKDLLAQMVQPQEEHSVQAFKADEKPIKGLPSYGDKIEALWRDNPGLSALEIATYVGCSVPTASKWKKRLEVPGKADDTDV